MARAFLSFVAMALAIGLCHTPAFAGNAAWYKQRAVAGAQKYDKPAAYIYAPKRNATERAAVSAAVSGLVLLEAYRAGGNRSLLDDARASGDSLVNHPDMNKDGKVGWGRYWARSSIGDGKGGATTFARGCSLPRNKAYDDELYDDARIVHFLLALFLETKEPKYLDTARRAIDDTWKVGKTTRGGKGFVYFKTIGPCSRGWQVKNINMLMAVPVAMLGSITKKRKYINRAQQLINEEVAQIEDAPPNFGYYSRDTMRVHPKVGGYVAVAQIMARDNEIVCNPKTASGDSCEYHLGIEARGLYRAASILGEQARYAPSVRRIMEAFRRRDGQLCVGSKTSAGKKVNSMACAAYYCALRKLDVRYDRLCSERIVRMKVMAQDTILGILIGLE